MSYSHPVARAALEWAKKNNKTYTEAAQRFGLHRNTLWREAKRQGERPRSAGRVRTEDSPSVRAARWAHDNHESQAEAARQFGVAQSNVMRAARDLGLRLTRKTTKPG